VKPYTNSNDVLNDAVALRKRAARDGYLFFTDLVDLAALRALRGRFEEILARHQWIDEGTAASDLLTTKEAVVEGMPEFIPVLEDFQRLEEFHAFAHDPGVLGMLGRLFGDTVLAHPRNIGRIVFPTTPTTPPHQDYVHIQGTPDVWTAWIPLGDCPRALGGIQVLAGSHRVGVYPVQRMSGAGGVGVPTDGLPGDWVAGDFTAGDALFFHSETIHEGLPNTTSDRFRLSVDYRYQAVSKPVTEASLLPHFNRFGWDWVYEGWQSADLQYYWREFDLELAPFTRDVYRFVEDGAAGPEHPPE
jgi:ectoine hydroxylase-related dioxygenase (phytanoyl-CoA dioxygenase family)